MSQIKLIKLLSFCTSLMFWNSIWLLYYLKFVNNQQIENDSEKIILDNSKSENSAINLSVISFFRGLVYPIGIFIVGGLLDKRYFLQIMIILIWIFIIGLFTKNFKQINPKYHEK